MTNIGEWHPARGYHRDGGDGGGGGGGGGEGMYARYGGECCFVYARVNSRVKDKHIPRPYGGCMNVKIT
jgi:hypothetical protein